MSHIDKENLFTKQCARGRHLHLGRDGCYGAQGQSRPLAKRDGWAH